jgi:hypothetical protein
VAQLAFFVAATLSAKNPVPKPPSAIAAVDFDGKAALAEFPEMYSYQFGMGGQDKFTHKLHYAFRQEAPHRFERGHNGLFTINERK